MIPLTPALMVLQAHTPGPRTIADAANEIMTLLDDFTFGEEEIRILEILAEFPPEDFMRCLEHLSQCTTLEGWPRQVHEVSYLERLYVDMNGAEFDALCEMMRARLLALKCGSPERWGEVVEKALAGETTPEIPLSLDYGPAKITSPRTLSRRSYPCDVTFHKDGSIRGKWVEHFSWFYDFGTPRNFRMQLSDLALTHYLHVDGKNEIVTLFDIKRMSDEQHRNFWFTTANLAGIVLSGGLIAAAKGAAKKALVAFVQIAVPAAGQYISEHDEEIRKLKYGREVITGFQILSLFIAGWGLYQLFSPAGKSFLGKLGQLKKDVLASNRGSVIAEEVGKRIAALEDALVEVKKLVVDKGLKITGASPSSSSRLMNSLKNRPPIHPQVPPPSRIVDGKCIATGKSEFEIIYEMRKHPDPSKLEVFKKDQDFLLVERTGGLQAERPTGYERCASFTKIIDIFDDLTSAKKKLLKAAKLNAATEIEVGIYKKIIEGETRFVVINGMTGKVYAPADDWISVGHYHHGAATVPGYRVPAINDVATSKMVAGQEATTKHTEIIFSHDKNGKVVEIEYGYDPSDTAGRYFVTIDGRTEKFSEMYPSKLQALLDPPGLSELDKVKANAKVFREAKLDASNYAAWWATFFPQ